jgi:hypothetical protein
MTMPIIEILEQRIAPANLLNPRTLVYTDVDGDEVTLVFSKNVFTGNDAAQLAKANEVFKFDTGTVAHETATAQQLRLIDFTKFPVIANQGSTVNGVGVTITAKQKNGGDGFVDVGAIKATGISLGKVIIKGDLGQIDAGASNLKIGVAGLTVNSIGKRGTGTQIPVPSPTPENPAPDLVSTITSELTALTVLEDVNSARIRVVDGKNAAQQITSLAKIGSLTIGGSLLGRAAVEAASDDTGVVECERDIGKVSIGTDFADGIIGGGGANSGRLTAGVKFGSIKISGSLVGGAGASSGVITSNNSSGAIKIGDDVRGGAGDSSGLIRIFGHIASVTIGDSLFAGAGPGSGSVRAFGEIKSVLINGHIDGTTPNSGPGSANLFANGLPKVTVKGLVFGGAGGQSAAIESGRDLGTLTIGSLNGGAGDGSASIVAHGKVKTVIIHGDLTGGAGHQSAVLRSGMDPLRDGDMGTVIVKGRVLGGGGDDSAAIISGGALKSVTISSAEAAGADALKGGAGEFSAAISARGTLGLVKLFGHLQGGNGRLSGSIFSAERVDFDGEFAGDIGSVMIFGNIVGGGGERSGYVQADGALKQLIAGSLTGGAGSGSGGVKTGVGLFGTGDAGLIRLLGGLSAAGTNPGAGSASLLIGGKLKTLFVQGETTGATIRTGETAGSLTFMGNVEGTTISALGQAVQGAATDLALAKLDVRGAVISSSILAGYNLAGNAANPDAQIGTVIVKGAWAASNLVAGVAAGTDAGYGNEFDVKAPGPDNPAIVSRIASITIGGPASASGNPADHFGIVAQLITKAKLGATLYSLDNQANSQTLDVITGVTIREIAL